MVAPVRGNDVMACLSAAIIAYDKARVEMTGQEIGQDAFSGVSETEIYNDIRAQGNKYFDVTLKNEPDFLGDVGVNTPTSPKKSEYSINCDIVQILSYE
jgi:hypothetical protein